MRYLIIIILLPVCLRAQILEPWTAPGDRSLETTHASDSTYSEAPTNAVIADTVKELKDIVLDAEIGEVSSEAAGLVIETTVVDSFYVVTDWNTTGANEMTTDSTTGEITVPTGIYLVMATTTLNPATKVQVSAAIFIDGTRQTNMTKSAEMMASENSELTLIGLARVTSDTGTLTLRLAEDSGSASITVEELDIVILRQR